MFSSLIEDARVSVFTLVLVCANLLHGGSASGAAPYEAAAYETAPVHTVAEPRLTKEHETLVPGAQRIPPERFGFTIPDGEVKFDNNENVLTVDENGNGAVAQIYVQIGENFIVLLPDGQLVERKADQVQITERPFQPWTAEKIAEDIIRNRLRGFQMRRFRNHVYVYNTSDAFTEATVNILHSMFNGMQGHVRAFGITPETPVFPLVVIMFRSEAQFQAFEPMPPGVVAYYNMASNHIVLHEESPLGRGDLAVGQLLSTIAHEGAHQVLHNIGVQKRLSLWPMWMAEGLAEYYAPTSISRNMRWKGAGQINDLRMFELEMYLQRSYAGFDGSTLKATVGARNLDSSGYAAAWALTHFLANRHRTEWAGFAKKYSDLRPFEGMFSESDAVEANLQHFSEVFGEDWAAIEQQMVNHLVRQRYESPLAPLPHFVTTVEYTTLNGRERKASLFHSRELAAEWATGFRDFLAEEERATANFEMRQFSNRNEASQFIRRWVR